jgi:hypothetical protein
MNFKLFSNVSHAWLRFSRGPSAAEEPAPKAQLGSTSQTTSQTRRSSLNQRNEPVRKETTGGAL